MNVSIKVRLSEKGRKARLLAGQDASEIQDIPVAADDPCLPVVVDAGEIQSDGSLVWKRLHYPAPAWDHLPTVAEVVAQQQTELEAKQAEEEQRKREIRDHTEEVLRERRVQTTELLVAGGGGMKFTYPVPAWPYYCDPEVRNSPEALAWVAECKALEAQAREACTAAGKAVIEREQQECAEAAERERQRRVSLGLKDGEIDLEVEDGALSEVPANCWETHSRGKNWLAIISVDPSSPGGLNRRFLAKAKGDSYYLVDDLSVGDAVEFGADYYSGRGRKSPTRWYGIVTRKTDKMVVLRQCSTGKAACKEAAKFQPDPDAVTQAVEEGIARVNGEGAIVPPPSDN